MSRISAPDNVVPFNPRLRHLSPGLFGPRPVPPTPLSVGDRVQSADPDSPVRGVVVSIVRRALRGLGDTCTVLCDDGVLRPAALSRMIRRRKMT